MKYEWSTWIGLMRGEKSPVLGGRTDLKEGEGEADVGCDCAGGSDSHAVSIARLRRGQIRLLVSCDCHDRVRCRQTA